MDLFDYLVKWIQEDTDGSTNTIKHQRGSRSASTLTLDDSGVGRNREAGFNKTRKKATSPQIGNRPADLRRDRSRYGCFEGSVASGTFFEEIKKQRRMGPPRAGTMKTARKHASNFYASSREVGL